MLKIFFEKMLQKNLTFSQNKIFLKGYGQTEKSSVYSALNYREIL